MSRGGLLSDLTRVLSVIVVNILAAALKTDGDQVASGNSLLSWRTWGTTDAVLSALVGRVFEAVRIGSDAWVSRTRSHGTTACYIIPLLRCHCRPFSPLDVTHWLCVISAMFRASALVLEGILSRDVDPTNETTPKAVTAASIRPRRFPRGLPEPLR